MIQVGNAKVYHGWGRDILPTLPADSFDSVVCDPPYGLSKEPDMIEVLTHWLAGDDYASTGGGFMGKTWDSFVPGPATWREIYRVLKPGGYALVFAGSRTVDLMGVAVRLAGFEVRDMIMWCYGSGFPKSLDVSKALDKMAGVEFAATPASGVGFMNAEGAGGYNVTLNQLHRVGESTDAARQWQGWGTALKPAHEPILVLRKPLSESSVAANVLRWGVGGINIDGCRVNPGTPVSGGGCNFDAWRSGEGRMDRPEAHGNTSSGHSNGRFPANLIHDGSPEVLACFPNAPGQQGVAKTDGTPQNNAIYGALRHGTRQPEPRIESDTSAARFFYKAPHTEVEKCNVSIVETLSNLLNQLEDSVQNLVAIKDSPADKQLSDSIHHFMSDMLKESKVRNAGGTPQIQSIEQKYLLELQRISLSETPGNRVNHVAILAQTYIITTTQNLLSLGGFADAAMWNTIETILAHGVKDSVKSRIIYCAKASKSDRGTYNNHPTVKPQALMRYLVRLVTPPGGKVLDSFAGSSTTGVAAIAEGFHPTLIEQDTDHFNLCLARCFEASY